jgi:hypothetical protein
MENKLMLPEEQELVRLEKEQAELEDQVASAELALETAKADGARFQHRYYQTVGRLYARLDELDARIAAAKARHAPGDATAQSRAQEAQAQARKSAEESGLIEALPPPPPAITAELRQAYRRAAKLIHPDRATTEPERLRRTELMARVNRAYEAGDLKAIEKLILEFGQDPEAIAGDDAGARLVKALRRIAQLRRRLGAVQEEMDAMRNTEIFLLKQNIEELESSGGNPLGALAEQLARQLTEREKQLQGEAT